MLVGDPIPGKIYETGKQFDEVCQTSYCSVGAAMNPLFTSVLGQNN